MISTTNKEERAQFASIALLVAEEAAALVSSGYRARPHAEEKSARDLVTEYDRASEEMLLTRLRSLAPGVPVVAEESSTGVFPEGPLVWHVDPLDGTTNFVHGHPFWCVAVGLMDAGIPVAGAVVSPFLGLKWVGWVDPHPPPGARRGEAFRNGEACFVSKTKKFGSALVATGFPPDRERAPQNNFGSFIAVKRSAQAVRRCGSAAIDQCFVADGTYEGYWERGLHTWDLAAPSAIVLAAGGTVTALDGGRVDYVSGNIVSSNGLIHDELLLGIARGGDPR